MKNGSRVYVTEFEVLDENALEELKDGFRAMGYETETIESVLK